MSNHKVGIFVAGLVLGVVMLAAPASANAQCPYSTGYSSYYAPSYKSSSSYYAPSYGYSQRSYGGGYYNAGRPRLRRALTVALVAGAAVAIADGNSNRSRSRRRR